MSRTARSRRSTPTIALYVWPLHHWSAAEASRFGVLGGDFAFGVGQRLLFIVTKRLQERAHARLHTSCCVHPVSAPAHEASRTYGTRPAGGWANERTPILLVPCLCGGPGRAAEPDRRGRAPSGKDRSRAASPSRAAEPQPSHVTHGHMASHASTVTRGDTGKSDQTATVRHLQACA